MKGLTGVEILIIGALLLVGSGIIFATVATKNCGEGCNNDAQCISGKCDSPAGGFCAPTNALTGCVNDYQCVLDACAGVTTTTTIAGQCYDEYLGWVSVGYNFGTGCCSGSSCSRNGYTWGYNEAGVFECVSDQQWNFYSVSCGTSTTTTSTTTTTGCNGCIYGYECHPVGTVLGTSCIDGYLYEKTCVSAGVWEDEIVAPCEGNCFVEGSWCGPSTPGSDYECCEELVCEYQLWENAYRCIVSGTTTTTTLVCPTDTCEWLDSDGNVVDCHPVGTEVGTMCIDGWFWVKTCMEDSSWEQVKAHECSDYDNICNIPTGEEGGFEVVPECESFSNCGPLGRVTDLGAPIIKAINEAINPFRDMLGLPQTEFKTRCEICSALYKYCKTNLCEVRWTICLDTRSRTECDMNFQICKLTAEIMNFKVLYGDLIFWLVVIIGVLILLSFLGVGINIFSAIGRVI